MVDTERARSLLLALVTVGIAAAAPPSAWATGIGFGANNKSMILDYNVTNPGATAGQKIGELYLSDTSGVGSTIELQKLDLGGDGVVSGDDSVLDEASIQSASLFDVLFAADVIKLAGANNYKLQGSVKVTDTATTIGSPSVDADFETSSVFLLGGFFGFAGPLSVALGNDALLLPGPGGAWAYDGVAVDTPTTPNEDSVQGRASLAAGRSAFDDGDLGGGLMVGPMTLDTFFGTNRDYSTAGLSVTVTPEPASILLLLGGTGLCRRRK